MLKYVGCILLALGLGMVSVAAQTRDAPPRAAVAPPPWPLSAQQVEKRDRARAIAARIAANSESARALMRQARFSGEIATASRSYETGSYGITSLATAQDADGNPRETGQPWRWASVTKQVIAVLVMQEVARGTIALDEPVSKYLPTFRSPNAGRITVRQLLRHQTGLPNPDDTPANAEGVPSFYTAGFDGSKDPLTGFCAGPVTGEAGGPWSYNNCDFMVAGALLEAVTGQSWQSLVTARIRRRFEQIDRQVGFSKLGRPGFVTTAPPQTEAWPGQVAGAHEPTLDIASYGASGALYGTTADLAAFDVHLASGQYLPPAALAEMWDGQPELGYLALGQWVFEAPLKGCAAPVRIVERRGAIGGVQVRNFILPGDKVALAMFTDSAEFDFGEIWQGAGFSYEMLSLVACPQGTP